MALRRITEKDLEFSLERLNIVSYRKFVIRKAYGKWQLLYQISRESGLSSVTGFHPKRELYEIIWAILNYVHAEKLASIKQAIRLLIGYFAYSKEITDFLKKLLILVEK